MKFTLSNVRRINLAVAGGLSTAYLFGQAISVNAVKRDLQLKTGDKIVQVPPKLLSLFQEVQRDIKLNTKNLQIKPFMSRGSDVKSVGFPLFSEIFIGVPEYYMFDEDDMAQFSIVVDGKEIPPTAIEYEPLKKAMTLSREAKKFGIAQEIYESQHSQILPFGILPLIIVINCNILSYFLEKYEKLLNKPLHRVNHYVIFLIGAWMYAFAFDIISVFKEAASDFMAAELGKSYVQGGIEYYQKMIKRNVIFKKLNKDAPYTEKGDINISLIRVTHMPLERRITYLTGISKGKKESVWEYIFM